MLASLLVDELQELCKGRKKYYTIPQDSKTYYFYCQEDDPEHRTRLGILKGILHQMVDMNDDIIPFCADKARSAEGTNLASAEIAQNLIETFLEYNPRQYIVLDGLDECETTEEIRQTVAFFMQQATKCDSIKQGKMRVLFMSQPLPDLVKDVMPQDDACVELKPIDNAYDIRAYVKERIPEFSSKSATISGFNLSEVDMGQMESIICRRSEGQAPPSKNRL